MSGSRTPGGDAITDDSWPVGLALSGGGLKSSLFHVGVLARLAELDLLRKVDTISAVSGGALVAALYHLHLKRTLDAEGEIDSPGLIGLVAAVERHLLQVAETDLGARLFDSLISNLKRVRKGHTSAVRLGDLLDRHLFRPVWNGDPKRPIELRDLAIHPRGDLDFDPITANPDRHCKVPALVIQATQLDTGHGWRFESNRMGEPTASTAARRLARAPRLAASPYRRLPDTHASMTLGRAVAASMATEGLLEPLELSDLYPDPDRSAHFLDVRLADGMMANGLGTDVLIERGCGRCIVSDGSGYEATRGGSAERMRAVQLDLLETSRPGKVVLIHPLSEVEAEEVMPRGPIGRGMIVKDRTDDDVTSYGVNRGLQKTIAGQRATFDAPSEIEAMTLMADGYLLAKRAFERLSLKGESWAAAAPVIPPSWRFSSMFDALRKPPRKLVRHLGARTDAVVQGPRLTNGQTMMFGLTSIAFFLSLIALGGVWSSLRPEPGEDTIWLLATGGTLSLAAWLFTERLFARTRKRGARGGLGWIEKCRVLAFAWPLCLTAQVRRRGNRAFLKAGHLRDIGIKPVSASKPTKADPVPEKLSPTKRAA